MGPHLEFDARELQPALTAARVAQGRMLGMASGLQLVDLGELQLTGWALEAVATAQIEGEMLQINSVRASAARLPRHSGPDGNGSGQKRLLAWAPGRSS
ncbi:DUF4172 domain-containing protein [Variovorax sp. PBL-H6]|uniref:DUF4172 domain-containing protein n=1 Tax=Variovorax sp. PBL-H6 TaxID=434009 RepID=UPI0022B29AA9|nr:DUF4172 domain-containing protein [Variovorax sp. PBL-H6]